ncbi:MAG: hypothetical protein L6266_01345 [Nanoarchaeota archaeon]|nr:hypothetical protein [Nanoarchaeota archaeon]
MASKKEWQKWYEDKYQSLEQKVKVYLKAGKINAAIDLYIENGKILKALNLYVMKGNLYKAEDLAREHGLEELAEMYKAMAEHEPQPKINS